MKKSKRLLATFYRYNSPFLEDVEIDNILMSKKISSDKKKNYKYFIGYMSHDYKIKPLHVMLPKTRAYG